MTLAIRELREEHLEDAAALTARRYRALREAAPDLPSQYGEVETLLPMLRNLSGAGPGMVALQGPELVGFLGAFPIPEFRGLPAVVSPEWGNAAPLDNSARIYEAMYTALSPAWLADGRTVHLVVSFANDRAAIGEWHMLGFGLAVGDAIRDLQPTPDTVGDVAIRRAGPADVDDVLRLETALVDHLAAPPTYLYGHEPSTPDECLTLLNDEAYAVWLAMQDGDAVAYLLTGPASHDASTIIRDAGTCSITGAFTEPDARGAGIATALLNRGLAWARDEGYVRCAVDFETMNPPARRFWLRHFTAVTFGLERHVDRRAGPATGS